MDHAAEAIVAVDLDHQIVVFNRAAERSFGYPARQAIGRPLDLLLPERLASIHRAHVREFAASAESSRPIAHREPLMAKRRDGTEFPVEIGLSRIEADGQVFFAAVIVDISERQRIHARLELADEILRRVKSLVVVSNSQGEISFVNEASREILGYAPAQLLGNEWWSATYRDSDEAASDREALVRAARGPQPLSSQPYERPIQTRTAETRWMLWQAARGPADAVIAIGHDITERRLAETALRESEAELRALFGAMHDVVLVIDRDGVYRKVAPTRPDFLAASPNELLGRTLSELFREEKARDLLAVVRRVLESQQPSQVEYQLVIGGVNHWFETTITPAGPDTTLWVARDISERRQRERELEAVAHVSTALRAVASRAEMFPAILDCVLDLFDADGAVLALRDPASGDTVFELGRGRAGESLTGVRLAAGEGIVGQVIAAGRPHLSEGTRAASFDERDDFLFGAGWAGACVPLRSQVATIGALWLLRAWPVNPGEIRVLNAIAEMSASAIQRASLHELTEQRLRRLAALRAVDQAITSSLDLDLTLKVLIHHVVAELRLDAAAVLLADPPTDRLLYAAGLGFKTRLFEQATSRLGRAVSGRAALEQRVVRLDELSPDEIPTALIRALAAEAFVSMVSVPLIAKGQVQGVLEVFSRNPLQPTPDWLDFLETLANQAAIAIDNGRLLAESQRSNRELTLAYDATIEGWSRALDLRDKETEGHTQRVTEMTLELARAFGVSETDLVHIRRGALLHDIGKLGVPDGILLKPSDLSEDEWVVMRKHPVFALEMLSPIEYLRPALDIPYSHHEKWDGGGYPRGLRGDQIPLAARIFAVVDVWDAVTSQRPYRPAWPREMALQHIRSLSGTHFDPAVVRAFLHLQASSPD